MSNNWTTFKIINSSYISSKDDHPFGHQDGRLFLRMDGNGSIVFFSIPENIVFNQNASSTVQPGTRSITSLPTETLLDIADKCSITDVMCLALANKTLAQRLSRWKHNVRPVRGIQINFNWTIPTAIMYRHSLLKRLKYEHSAPAIRLCLRCNMLRTTDRTFWEGELHRIKTTRVANPLQGLGLDGEQVNDTEQVFEFALRTWQAGGPGVLCPRCIADGHHNMMRNLRTAA